ncbi:ribosome biogenesis factor YjgA [methane-oxidizing endosymbiont of Gigantopelta aegis]|uniref:ribosome biogenesis factor YjgA n=1 Tax=methane-oxidizing endosymbiont of Gigantopelta aegis TaxID=2794938 RepID=UPI0018DE4C70|nr:ribosome biogenesis factor YjgA [methane-oxidizing endosymbiont of Gigantopelta aegis]
MIDDLYDDDEEAVEYAIRPNKTAIKRDIARIADLAEQICALTENQIKSLELPERVEASVLEARKMPPKAARKRLLKFVTGQLRTLDLEPITEKIARIKSKSIHAAREHHQAEQWRDKLLSENGQDALTDLLAQFPQADRQHIRQLQRNAQKETQAGKPPKSARLLYQEIRALIEHAE